MNSKDIFIELFGRLPQESQQKVLVLMKDLAVNTQADDEFKDVGYRELYYELFFQIGRHIDSLVSLLQAMEEIHMQELDKGIVIDLPKPEDD